MQTKQPQIEVSTIRMLFPLISPEGVRERRPLDAFRKELVSYEAFLRRKAYRDTTIRVNEEFFNDTDMQREYFLVVVYVTLTDKTFDLNRYKDGDIFLADRLSGNISAGLYRKNRKYIFSLFCSEIFKHNRHRSLLLMARKEKRDKLLTKYLHWGFHVIGSTVHKGKEHWIALQDFKKVNAA